MPVLALIMSLFVGVLVSGTALADPVTSAGRLANITSNNALRVCIWSDYYSISWRNPRSGELVGIDIDLARELASDLGVEARFVDSAFSTLIPDVLEDRCDIAMFAIGITPQRSASLRFTSPHLISDVYAISTRGNRRVNAWEDIDQPGIIVAVARGTLHEPVMRERLRHAELLVVDNPHAREQEVHAGRADVFMTDYPYSQRMLTNATWARLISPPEAWHLTPYAWAMAPGDDRWHETVEAFIRRIKHDGRLIAAAERHGLTPIVAP